MLSLPSTQKLSRLEAERMKMQIRLLLSLTVALILLMTVSCASEDRVDRLEQDIRAMQTQLSQQMRQQQSVEVDVGQKLSAISESVNSVDQRLTNLEKTTIELSNADDDIRQHISEIESKLDARTINKILATPLEFVVAALVILLIGILSGVWFCCCRVRTPTSAEVASDEESVPEVDNEAS